MAAAVLAVDGGGTYGREGIILRLTWYSQYLFFTAGGGEPTVMRWQWGRVMWRRLLHHNILLLHFKRKLQVMLADEELDLKPLLGGAEGHVTCDGLDGLAFLFRCLVVS